MLITLEQRAEIEALYGPEVELANDYGGKLKLTYQGFFVVAGSDFAQLLRQAAKIDWRGIGGCIPQIESGHVVERYDFRPVRPVSRGDFRAPSFERGQTF
ncbi:MAG: hypothetical protein NTY19_04820 [Planctomycetota bacterium]|nr:hypothetical protein [Planctomycetota bacterium]